MQDFDATQSELNAVADSNRWKKNPSNSTRQQFSNGMISSSQILNTDNLFSVTPIIAKHLHLLQYLCGYIFTFKVTWKQWSNEEKTICWVTGILSLASHQQKYCRSLWDFCPEDLFYLSERSVLIWWSNSVYLYMYGHIYAHVNHPYIKFVLFRSACSFITSWNKYTCIFRPNVIYYIGNILHMYIIIIICIQFLLNTFIGVHIQLINWNLQD
jgi:hypothetical protein